MNPSQVFEAPSFKFRSLGFLNDENPPVFVLPKTSRGHKKNVDDEVDDTRCFILKFFSKMPLCSFFVLKSV